METYIFTGNAYEEIAIRFSNYDKHCELYFEVVDGDVLIQFSGNFFIRRTPYEVDPISGPQGCEIIDIIPVWFDCCTYHMMCDEDDVEIDNDFDFEELKCRLIDA